MTKVAATLPAPTETPTCHFCFTILESPIHLFEVATRTVVCVCDDCAAPFEKAAGAPFKSIPQDTQPLADFKLPAATAGIAPSENVTFIYYSTATAKMMSVCASETGPVEAIVPRDLWKPVIEANPALQEMRPDVEALLIIHTGDKREYFIAPIDICYNLVKVFQKGWEEAVEDKPERTEVKKVERLPLLVLLPQTSGCA